MGGDEACSRQPLPPATLPSQPPWQPAHSEGSHEPGRQHEGGLSPKQGIQDDEPQAAPVLAALVPAEGHGQSTAGVGGGSTGTGMQGP